jgi:hypothetical protein
MRMTVQSTQSKANILAFMRQARLLQDNKIFFNRDFLKGFSVMEKCFELSKQKLGNDFGFLDDATGVRLYLRDVFGNKSLRYFEDANGEIQLDIEHALLFYYKLLSLRDPASNTALGLLYFITGHQLDDEFQQISKVAPKGKITPAFELDSKLFRWRRCPFVLRRYMLTLSQVEGYTAYYFEKPAFGQIAYLMHNGMSFADADTMMKQSTGGLFYSYLPTYIENMLIPSILSGGFDTTLMDGLYAQTYQRDNAIIAQGYTIDDVYNVYNQMVKPNMVDFMGMIITNVMGEAEKNPYLNKSDLTVYHISPQRLGILVKDTVQIQNALPALHKYFQPVKSFDLAGVVTGDFL